jgi:hypothetical protein
VVRWRLRFAAGVCLVAASLLMGGGTVALADPGLGGSAPNGDDGTHDSVHGGATAGGPVGNVTDTVRQTIQGVTGTPGSTAHPGQQPSTGPTSTLGSGRQPGQQPSTGATTPKTQAGGTDTADQKEDAGLVPVHPNPVAAVPNVVAPVTKAVVAPVTDVLPPVTDVVTPVTDVVAPVTNAVAAPITDVLASVTNVVAQITDVVSPVTDVVAPVTNVLTPVSDIIAPGQYMPTSVAGAVVPLTQPPSDVSSFLLGIAGVAPVQDGSGGIHRPGLAAAAGASGPSPVPLGLPFAGVSGVPVAGNATRVATLDVILLGRVSALSGMAPQAPNDASAMGAESSYPHIFDELLLIASLWAVAVVALPGVGGLVILTVVGVRIGYGRPDSHREHRAFWDSPIPRAVKRWMSAR